MFKKIFIALMLPICALAMDSVQILEISDAQYLRRALEIRAMRIDGDAAQESISIEINNAIQRYIEETVTAPYNIPFLRWVTQHVMGFDNLPDAEWDESSFTQTETWFAYAPDFLQKKLITNIEDSFHYLRSKASESFQIIEEIRIDSGDIEASLAQEEYIAPIVPIEKQQDAIYRIMLFINELIASEKNNPESLIVYSGTSLISRVYIDLFNAIGKKLKPSYFQHYHLRMPNDIKKSPTIWLNTTLFENIWYGADCTLFYLLGNQIRLPSDVMRNNRRQFIKDLCKYFSIESTSDTIENIFQEINNLIALLKTEVGCSLYQICIPKELGAKTINNNVCFAQYCNGSQVIPILSALSQPKTYGLPETLASFRGIRAGNHDPERPVRRVYAIAPYTFIHNNHDKIQINQYTLKSSALMLRYNQALQAIVDTYFTHNEEKSLCNIQ